MNKLKVLYEDNHIIVVFKPSNVLSQSDITNDVDMLSLIKKYLKEKYQKPGNVYLGLVHRLDRVVSGVMVFAKTSKAASRLSEEIRLNNICKVYLAVVHGKLDSKGVFIDYLEKTKDFNTIVTDSKKGKYAELSYELLEYNEKEDLSLALVKLKTGRHHQIRVQFQSRGFPLVGDKRYGNDNASTIGLTACSLSFKHPTKKELMTFEWYADNLLFDNFKYVQQKKRRLYEETKKEGEKFC